jgi:PilZ domain-containing protein
LIFALKLALPNASFAPNPERRELLMSDGSERREARRFNMNLPMRVMPREGKGHELNAQTRDLSYRGLYFLAEADFKVGNEIDFVITLPQQVTQSGDVNIRCQGEIVRVEATENGRIGIAAKIARYEFLPATATAA